MELIIKNIGEIDSVAGQFLRIHRGKRIFAFFGEMGSGKTTFIKALCRRLGVTDMAVSPSYTLVNEYHIKGGDKIYHFDFYRINRLEEVFDIGIEEYFDSEEICFLEWPERIESILPEETVNVYITIGKNNERILASTEI